MTDFIEKMMALSTGHITQEVAETIDNGLAMLSIEDPNERPYDSEEWVTQLVIYPHGEYGWLIYIADDLDIVDLPKSLEDCLGFASDNDCRWLLLDQDAAHHPELTTYDW